MRLDFVVVSFVALVVVVVPPLEPVVGLGTDPGLVGVVVEVLVLVPGVVRPGVGGWLPPVLPVLPVGVRLPVVLRFPVVGRRAALPEGPAIFLRTRNLGSKRTSPTSFPF